MYKYANSSLKEYFQSQELMESLAKDLKDIHPEYQEIFDEFVESWDDAMKVLSDDEIRLFVLSTEHSQKEISYFYGISPGETSKRIFEIYRKLALFYFKRDILFDEVV